MLRFRRMGTLQKFASVHASVFNHFTKKAASPADRFSKQTMPPLSPSGANSAAHNRLYFLEN